MNLQDVHLTRHFKKRLNEVWGPPLNPGNTVSVMLIFGQETDPEDVATLTGSTPDEPSHTPGSRYIRYKDHGVLVLSPARGFDEGQKPWVAVTFLPIRK